MKKLFLLGALVYVGQLFGMENPQPQLGVFGYLPTELHEKIIQDAIASSDTVEGVIKAINAASVRGARYDNIKDFTKLVHILGYKFNTTTADIANKFNIPIAQQYLDLGKKLLSALKVLDRKKWSDKVGEIMQLINNGADVNFSIHKYYKAVLPKSSYVETPLHKAIDTLNIEKVEIVKTLLKYGANPTADDLSQAKFVMEDEQDSESEEAAEFVQATEIVQIIENAMQKK